MKIEFEQKLFPLPYNTFNDLKNILRFVISSEDEDKLLKEQASQLIQCFDSLSKILQQEKITGYYVEHKFDDNNNIEIIFRLKEIKSE